MAKKEEHVTIKGKHSKSIPAELKKMLVDFTRKKHQPALHKAHRNLCISYRTLFYMKEYGPRAHVSHVIMKESIKILILASLISTIGGFGLQSIEDKLITIMPLIILLPALSGMVGNFGTIVSSKFTTMLYTGKIKENWHHSRELHSLFITVLIIAVISAFYISLLAMLASHYRGFPIDMVLFMKVVSVSLLATAALVSLIFVISVTSGFFVCRHNEDPNNFLIPITTAVADLGSFLIYAAMIVLFF